MQQDEREGGEPIVTGECNRCCQCCFCLVYDQVDQRASVPPKRGSCPQLDIDARLCRIWDDRPEGCRAFPTVRDFELEAVPEGCGYRLVKGDI